MCNAGNDPYRRETKRKEKLIVRQRHDVHSQENQLRAPEKCNTLHKRVTQTCKYHRVFHRNDSGGGEAVLMR